MSQVFKLGLAGLLLLMGVASFWYLRTHSPAAQAPAPVAQAPLVSTIQVQPQTQSIPIDLHGLVTAASEVVLAAQTNGVVTQLSPRLVAGAAFRRNDILLSVDDREMQRQLSSVQAALLSAQNRLRRLQAEQSVDQALPGLPNVSDAYRSREQEMRTQVELAKADLQLAQQQIESAHIRAPFDGRVQQVLVSVGQRIAPGIELVRFYGTATARVRLAVSDRQLQLLDAARLGDQSPQPASAHTKVLLRQDLAGQYRYWQGRLLGVEANVDPRNQMVYLLVSVDKAFEKTQQAEYPLLSGQVLEARINSRLFQDLSRIPRQLVQSGAFVWCVDADNRLYRQAVQVLYTTQNHAYVRGLSATQKLVSSALNLAIEGMSVRVQEMPTTDSLRIKMTPPL